MIKIKLKSYSDPLDEGRVDDMKKKYPGKDDLIDQFAKAPGNNKYLDWMLRHHEETSPDEMLKAVTKFDKYISQVKQKDINSYRNFESLQDTVEDLKPPKKELERTGTNALYEDDEFSITRPTNREAACKLGIGTKWCIAATKSKNYFNTYAQGGAYHYFLTIKNLPDGDPNHLIAYTIVSSLFSDVPRVEIYDSEDKLIDRKAVVDTIDEVLTKNEHDAQSKEERLFQIMLADFEKRVPSDAGDPTDPHYDSLAEILSIIGDDEVNNYTLGRVESLIYDIFYDLETDRINSDPRFVKRQIKRLIGIDSDHIDKYFINAFNDKRPDRIGEAINANITPEQKSEILQRVQNRKKEKESHQERKINELVDVIFSDPKYKSMLDLYKDEKINAAQLLTTIRGLFPSYSESETESAYWRIASRLESTNESKLFSFNKDKKMFKLLR